MSGIDAALFEPCELAAKLKENCGQCAHIQRWINGEVSPPHAVKFYCGVTRSNRTANKLLKVKRKTPACGHFIKARQQ
jgi:hypothetical protein